MRRWIVGILLAGLVWAALAAVAPARGAYAASQGKSGLVRLTVVNSSEKVFTLLLRGPGSYYFVVEPGTTMVYTPNRGVYSVRYFECGVYSWATLDLSKQKTIIRRGCGSAANPHPGDQVEDRSNEIKLVKISLKNESTSSSLVIFHGPATFVFSVSAGQTSDYTVPRGKYTYEMYICGVRVDGTFQAHSKARLKLKCP